MSESFSALAEASYSGDMHNFDPVYEAEEILRTYGGTALDAAEVVETTPFWGEAAVGVPRDSDVEEFVATRPVVSTIATSEGVTTTWDTVDP